MITSSSIRSRSLSRSSSSSLSRRSSSLVSMSTSIKIYDVAYYSMW